MRVKSYFVILLFLLLLTVTGNAQTLPVTVSTVVQGPYTPYLSDYFSPESSKISATLVFNDHNEVSWNVKLRITIESNRVKIQTRPEFVPPSPIRLTPGVPVKLQGGDLSPYMNYNNLIVQGISQADLIKNSKLPEDFYMIYIEALDYNSGVTLSRKTGYPISVRLSDEPTINTPVCGAVIKPTPTQNILFQWQLSNAIGISASDLQYQLTLYEVTDWTINPLYAIQNNKVLKIFESDFLNQNTFLYDMSAPVLDIGKRYAYTVQVKEINGKDIFKNNGVSQVCWFSYGYPLNGLIALVSPLDKAIFGRKDELKFSWSSPNNMLNGQQITYKFNLVKVGFEQTPEDALKYNVPFHQETSFPTNRRDGWGLTLTKKLDPQTDYAWQVIASTEGQEIARSEVYTFRGPGIIDKFWAGNHEVEVRSTFNRDFTSLEGVGLVKLSLDGKTQEVNFNNLLIKEVGGIFILEKGEISGILEDTTSISLNPALEENGAAYFHPKKFNLNTDGLKMYGYVNWALPHPVTSSTQAYVTSEEKWVNYDEYKVYGGFQLNNTNYFTLFEPYKFKLNLAVTSDFLINNNEYRMRFDGFIEMPESIKGVSLTEKFVAFPFSQVNQLLYIKVSSVNLNNNLLLLSNTNLVMNPTSYIIDLSEKESPLKLNDTKEWKGVYIEKFSLDYNTDADKFGQLVFKKKFSETYELSSGNDFKNWITSTGLDFKLTKKFSSGDLSTFNQFPAQLNELKIDIEKNSIKSSGLTGSIIIPFINEKQAYTFSAPLTNNGLQYGYLDNIEGASFKFNKDGGEQEINITIQRAVFADRERLDMTIDVEWPSLNISMKALTGFKAWGNYNIGFLRPGGAIPLSNQLNAVLNEYPITIEGVGAGNSSGAYAIGVTGRVVMSEDISGDNGAPEMNIYSTVPNELLPKTKETNGVVIGNATGDQSTIPSNTASNTINENYKIIENDLINKLYKNSVSNVTLPSEELSKEFVKDGELKSYEVKDFTGGGEKQVSKTEDKTWSNAKFTFNQQKLVLDIVANVTAEISTPANQAINKVAGKINKEINDRVYGVTDSLNKKINSKLNTLLDSLALKLIKLTKKDSFDPSEHINDLADIVAGEVSKEVTEAINNSVNQNITGPMTGFITSEIANKTNIFINTEVNKIVTDAIDGKFKSDEILDGLTKKLPDMLEGIGKETFAQVNLNKIRSTVVKTGTDIFSNINTKEILERLNAAIIKQSGNIVKKSLQNAASDKINNLAENIVDGESSGAVTAGVGVKMNFDNLGRNLKEGRIDKVFKLDPVTVALNTKFVAFSGLLYYTPDDPVYGKIWKGDVGFKVKLPKEFSLGGTYVSGKKDDFNYWFCQLTGADESQKKSIGGIIPQKANELSNPVQLGPVKLVAAAGRLFHHMSDAPGQPIIPDKNTNYGAYVNFIFFDSKNKGESIRLDVAAGVQIRDHGNYVIDFEGNVQCGSPNPQIMTIDPLAVAKGGLKLKYNSAESHFLGMGYVDIKQKAMCAAGSILVETKPGFWRVLVGTRDQKIMITPACKGWGAAGWVGVDPTTVSVGLGVSFSFNANIGFDIKVAKGGINVSAGAAAGIQAIAQYKPTLILMEAGVWVEIWGNVSVYYNFKDVKKGTIELVDLYCSADLVIVFNPEPVKAKGQVKGHVEVLGLFGCDFDAGFEKTL